MTEMKSYLFNTYYFIKRSIKLASVEINEHLILKHLKRIDKCFEASTASFLTKGNSSTVIKIDSQQKDFAARRDNLVNFLKSIRRSLKKSRLKKACEKAVNLNSTNFKTLSPLALIEDHLFSIRIRSFFISFFIKGKTLKDFLKNQDTTYNKKEQIANKVINTILQWHGLVITHRDPKAANIIIKDCEIYLIDTEDVRVLKNKPLKIHNISRDWSIILYNFYQNPQIRKKLVKKISLSFNQFLNYFTKVLIKKNLKQKPPFFTSFFLEKDSSYVIVSRQTSIFQNLFLAIEQNFKKVFSLWPCI